MYIYIYIHIHTVHISYEAPSKLVRNSFASPSLYGLSTTLWYAPRRVPRRGRAPYHEFVPGSIEPPN